MKRTIQKGNRNEKQKKKTGRASPSIFGYHSLPKQLSAVPAPGAFPRDISGSTFTRNGMLFRPECTLWYLNLDK
jgi:hypothetical protein